MPLSTMSGLEAIEFFHGLSLTVALFIGMLACCANKKKVCQTPDSIKRQKTSECLFSTAWITQVLHWEKSGLYVS